MTPSLRWCLAGLAVFFTTGCDLYETPSRFVDTEVRAPIAAAVSFTDLPTGQVLTGNVPLQIDLDSLNLSATEVTLYVDTPEAGYPIGLPLPQTFTLRTADFPDGPHTLILEVRDGATRLGLGGLGGTTTHVFGTDVVFRQTPLVGPTIESLTWDDATGLTLSWTPSDHPFFAAYRVMRRADWDGPEEWTEAARITEPSVTSFSEAGPAVIGAGATYRVDVETSTEGIAQSELASVQRGTAVFAGGTTRRPFVTAGQSAFVIERTDGTLQAIANDGDEVFWEAHPWIAAEDFNYVASLVPTSITADGGGMVLLAQGQRTPYDLHDSVALYMTNLEVPGERARRIDPGVPIADAVAGPDGRLVVLDSTGTLHVVDAASGDALGAETGLDGQALRITGDRTTAFVLRYTDAGRCVLTSVDVSADTPQRLAERPLPLAGAGCQGSVFEGPSTLVVRRSASAVERWDARTLETQAALDLTGQPDFDASDRIADVLPGARGTYFAVQRPETNNYTAPHGAILRVDASTLNVTQQWMLRDTPQLLGAPDGEAHLFVYGGPFDRVDRPEYGPTAWKITLP
jgi:hypothetical protein